MTNSLHEAAGNIYLTVLASHNHDYVKHVKDRELFYIIKLAIFIYRTLSLATGYIT